MQPAPSVQRFTSIITVIFSTRNGAATLPTMLESLGHVQTTEPWELLAVDNGSTDETRDILEQHASHLPIRVITQPEPGKNRALNAALPSATGDLIVLTDDDIIADPDWLTALRTAATEHPDYDVFGGKILPHWLTEPPRVILDNAPLGITYAITPPDQAPGPIFPGLVWGPNMAVRRTVFDHGHRFAEHVGPRGKNYVMGSETEFTIRVAEHGHKSWYTDAARVKHIIRPDQSTPDWVIRRAFRYGRNHWQQIGTGGNVPTIAGIPRWTLVRYVQHLYHYLAGSLRKNRDRVFLARWDLSYLNGYFYQAWISRKKT